MNPALRKGGWDEDEDRILKAAQKSLGNKWVQIAQLLPGRSENSCKNRFNSSGFKSTHRPAVVERSGASSSSAVAQPFLAPQPHHHSQKACWSGGATEHTHHAESAAAAEQHRLENQAKAVPQAHPGAEKQRRACPSAPPRLPALPPQSLPAGESTNDPSTEGNIGSSAGTETRVDDYHMYKSQPIGWRVPRRIVVPTHTPRLELSATTFEPQGSAVNGAAASEMPRNQKLLPASTTSLAAYPEGSVVWVKRKHSWWPGALFSSWPALSSWGLSIPSFLSTNPIPSGSRVVLFFGPEVGFGVVKDPRQVQSMSLAHMESPRQSAALPAEAELLSLALAMREAKVHLHALAKDESSSGGYTKSGEASEKLPANSNGVVSGAFTEGAAVVGRADSDSGILNEDDYSDGSGPEENDSECGYPSSKRARF